MIERIEIVNNSPHDQPRYATALSAGMDIRAWLPGGVVKLEPLERFAVTTGLSIALPAGYEAQIRSRSGLAIYFGISVLNSPGTIDADYRGEIKVILINLSNKPVTIKDGDRIAQMVISQYTQAVWDLRESLSETERGAGGCGSTGLV